MNIQIVIKFETSYIGDNCTSIEAKILTASGIEICAGTDKDTWSDRIKSHACAKQAVKTALDRMQHMLNNATDVAKNAGLL